MVQYYLVKIINQIIFTHFLSGSHQLQVNNCSHDKHTQAVLTQTTTFTNTKLVILLCSLQELPVLLVRNIKYTLKIQTAFTMDVSKCLYNLLASSTHSSRVTINLHGHAFRIPVLACLLLLLSAAANFVNCTPKSIVTAANSSHFGRGCDVQFPKNHLM